MNISELLAHLQSLDIRVWVEEGRLRVNAPKGVLTVELRETLASRKDEIIAYLQETRASIRGDLPAARLTIERQEPRLEDPPLSLSQQRLWFLDQFEPGLTAYTVQIILKIDGDLDRNALQKSINEIVRRHENLRTTFAKRENGLPVQVIRPFVTQELPFYDLTRTSVQAAEREAACVEYIRQQSTLPFDLENGPLFRTQLVRAGQQNHYLMCIMHHIISDGWSNAIFLKEMTSLYLAFTTGQPSSLPDLPIQFSDYAIWQRKVQTTQALKPQLDFWLQKLGGLLPVLDLPGDHQRPAFQTFHGATIYQTLPGHLASRLKQLCKQQEVTPFMLLLAAYDALLYRYTGQEDILVGTPIANRNHTELAQLIGFFANTIVMRSQLTGDTCFTDFLNKVRQDSLEAFTHHEIPFDLIVDALHPVRDTSHSPVFQVMFMFQNMNFQNIAFEHLAAKPVIIDNGTAKYDLTLIVWDTPEGFTTFFEYNTDIFDRSTVERMMGHYQTLLEGICDNPDLPISSLPLLSREERQVLLDTWNQTGAAYPEEQTIPALISAQAQRMPAAIAVGDEQQHITYQQLEERSNQLARYLRQSGVGPDALVGICLRRSINMVIGLLAILKAGGAYVPLDPTFPEDRLAFMLDDSKAGVLLTHSDLAWKIRSHTAQTVCLDTIWPSIEGLSRQPLESSSAARPLAYVIYTSGSTGRPKGVEVFQSSVVNLLISMQRDLGVTGDDVLLSVTTLSFDIAGLEIYLPLISGGRLILASSLAAANGTHLAQLLDEHEATLMQATPSTWRLMIASGWSGRDHFQALCGGEAFPADLAAPLLQRCDRLWNLYGPTETTIWSTMSRITSVEDVVSIGRPIANTSAYLLDAAQQPVPVGIPGELYIGGAGVARGYRNRPDLTAERFVTNPFAPPSGQPFTHDRLYRTGDLCKFLPDGQIEYLGRMDFQVKVRGFRIELGEIETVLAQHEAVEQAVVIAREDTQGDKRLLAYLTLRGPQPSISDLRAHLLLKLPEYMLPSAFIILSALPLTPNGKIDRKALPAPELSRPDLETRYASPGNTTEQTLTDIWQAVLKVDHVGIHDNFFELGGHSLLIVQVHHQVCQRFKTDITIAQMFQYPTIHSLAQFLIQPQQNAAAVRQQDIHARAQLQKEALNRQRRSANEEGHGK